jgi:hypothetical protein
MPSFAFQENFTSNFLYFENKSQAIGMATFILNANQQKGS